jgi:tetratricopeptide (TPR) repeat protein
VTDRPEPAAVSTLIAELFRLPELDAATLPFPRPGEAVGRFTVLRELGRGGFGRVFEARDEELRRGVALKILRATGRQGRTAVEASLRREAEAAAQLSHPNIVTIHDVGNCPVGPYLVLELLRGEPLAARLERGPLPVRAALAAAVEVCRAMVHAHAAGVLHRDLKPANVFLVEGGPAKVLDFGLAATFGVRGPSRSGTPGYMAPEQAAGGAEDERTDLYALGLLLHEMLAGPGPPVPGAPRPPLDRPGLPAALLALVARATAPAPGDRHRDAAELLQALLEVERGWTAPPAAPAPAAASVEAWRTYFLGEQCVRSPALGQDCGALLRRAVALDPGLAVAHYELAVWLRWFGGEQAEQEAALRAALRNADRASERERALIEAFAAHVGGDDEAALAIYRRVVEAWPDEVRAWYQAGDILRHRDELAAALPWFEQVVALDPEYGWAAGHFAEALGALGRHDELRAWSRRWDETGGPAALHGLSVASGWLGDLEAARRAGERAQAVGGGAAGREDQLAAVFFSGRFADAEREVRQLAAPGSPVRRMGYYALAALQAFQGRRGAGLAMLEELAREVPAVLRDWNYHAIRADYLLGDADLEGVQAAIERVAAADPRAAAEHAVSLAWLGALEPAGRLAAGLPRGSVLADSTAALVAWHRGDREGALAGLRATCARTPVVAWRLAPLYVLGELAHRAGRFEEATDALTRFERLYAWRQMWRSWAWPRSQLLLADAHARLGDPAAARARLRRLLAAWSGAEPGSPLLEEARALAARLDQAPPG